MSFSDCLDMTSAVNVRLGMNSAIENKPKYFDTFTNEMIHNF